MARIVHVVFAIAALGSLIYSIGAPVSHGP
jgi:hypothetical protein